MAIKNNWHFSQGIDVIYDSFRDESFIRRKLAALGARNIEVEIVEEEYAVKVNIHREMPVEVPALLQKYVKPWNKMIQREIWTKYTDGSYG